MTRPARSPSSRPLVVAWTLLVAATILVYAATFSAPFVFDDVGAVTQNPSIEHVATALNPPAGLSVTGRPVANLSLALNHALSGRAPWSYHALNLALHLATAAMLFAAMRRILLLPPVPANSPGRWTTSGPGTPPVISAPGNFIHPLDLPPSEGRAFRATLIAFATAALWCLHPLQTAAVTYVMQRTEVLVSLCYVATLYGFIRYATAASAESNARIRPLGRRGWAIAAVIACAVGMATKEVIVTAPVFVSGFDRVFVSGSFAESWRRHRWFHLALAATWSVLALLMIGTEGRSGSAGFALAVTPAEYAQTQLYALAHYLQLVLWPQPLVFDYGVFLVRDPWSLAFGAALVVGLVACAIGAWRRHPKIAFAVGGLLLLLAPTSSMLPIATQTMAEHRMYLALVLPVLIGVIGLTSLVRRRALVIPVLLVLGGALAGSTFARNVTYRTPRRLWADTVAKQPQNARAHYNLGLAAWAEGDAPAATAAFLAAVGLEPSHGLAHLQLGRISSDRNLARPHLIAAAHLLPDSAAAAYEAGVAYLEMGHPADALPLFERSVRLDPRRAAAHYNLGSTLAALQRYPEALTAFETAARLDPADGAAARNVSALRAYLSR